MKKTTIMILMFALVATMVLAVPEPTVTQLGNSTIWTDKNFERPNSCAFYGTKVYCFDGTYRTDTIPYISYGGILYSYDVETEVTTLIANLTEEKNTVFGVPGGVPDLWVYNNQLFGIWKPSSSLNPSIPFSLDFDGTDLTAYTNASNAVSYISECQLRPNSDEIWCFYGDAPGGGYVWDTGAKYDIGDDTWTNFSFTGLTGTDNVEVYFGDDDTVYMVGDQGIAFTYNVETSTKTAYSPEFTDFIFQAGFLYQDTMYVWSGYNDTSGAYPLGMYWFNFTDSSSGKTSDFWDKILTYQRCVNTDDLDTVYCMGGFLDDSEETPFVYEIQFPEIVIPSEPEAEEEEVRTGGGGGSFAVTQQNIQKLDEAKQQATPSYNSVEQFILNIRAFILNLFGYEV